MIRRALGLVILAAFLTPASLLAQEGPDDAPPVVKVTAKDYEFEMPEEVPSGWVTFTFENAGEEEHYFSLTRLPEGKTYQDLRTEAQAVFEEVWNRYTAQEITRSEMVKGLRSEIPQWYLTGAKPHGGVGLTEPGESARATVKLEPGTYYVACAVKTPQGSWHEYRGMTRKLTVTPERTNALPPTADARLTLSKGRVDVSGQLAKGSQTVAVHVKGNPPGLANYALYLVRLSGDTSLQKVVEWMHPLELGQYRAPAPGYSLGGLQPMTAGSTGYLTGELTPGRYAWVVPIYAEQGMVAEFTIE